MTAMCFLVRPIQAAAWLLKALVQAGNIARVPGRLTGPHTDPETDLSYRVAERWIHQRTILFPVEVFVSYVQMPTTEHTKGHGKFLVTWFNILKTFCMRREYSTTVNSINHHAGQRPWSGFRLVWVCSNSSRALTQASQLAFCLSAHSHSHMSKLHCVIVQCCGIPQFISFSSLLFG